MGQKSGQRVQNSQNKDPTVNSVLRPTVGIHQFCPPSYCGNPLEYIQQTFSVWQCQKLFRIQVEHLQHKQMTRKGKWFNEVFFSSIKAKKFQFKTKKFNNKTSLFLWKYASGGLVDDRVLFFWKCLSRHRSRLGREPTVVNKWHPLVYKLSMNLKIWNTR